MQYNGKLIPKNRERQREGAFTSTPFKYKLFKSLHKLIRIEKNSHFKYINWFSILFLQHKRKKSLCMQLLGPALQKMTHLLYLVTATPLIYIAPAIPEKVKFNLYAIGLPKCYRIYKKFLFF